MADKRFKSIAVVLPQSKAKLLVKDYIESRQYPSDDPIVLDLDKDIYVVWFAKTLQNWKALVSTTIPDGKYYEITYNGDVGEAYLDAYVKIHNVVYPDPINENPIA